METAAPASGQAGTATAESSTKVGGSEQGGEAKSESAAKTDSQPNVKDAFKAAAEKAKKKYKVYGEEVEVDESRFDEYIQKGLAFEKKGSQVAAMEKKLRQLDEAVTRGDMDKIMSLLGEDRFHDMAVKHLQKLIEDEEKSPQQREWDKRTKELEERENRIKAEEDRKRQEYEARLDEHYQKEFDEEISSAVQKHGLPVHPKVMVRMADLMLKNLDLNYKIPTDRIAGLVKKELMGEVRTLASALEPAQLAEIFGDEISSRFRQHGLNQLRDPLAGNKVNAPVQAKGTEQKQEERKPFQSMEETRPTKETWKERLARIKAEG
jgi:hypothetical protein